MAKAKTDVWMYRGGKAKLFLEGSDIPSGWKDAPKAGEEVEDAGVEEAEESEEEESDGDDESE